MCVCVYVCVRIFWRLGLDLRKKKKENKVDRIEGKRECKIDKGNEYRSKTDEKSKTNEVTTRVRAKREREREREREKGVARVIQYT